MLRLVPPLVGCLTLGLAPFVPEPHIIGKLRWVVGGAQGMTTVDWFDLAFHGAPWMWLAVVALQVAGARDRLRNDHRSLTLTALCLAGATLCVLWATC